MWASQNESSSGRLARVAQLFLQFQPLPIFNRHGEQHVSVPAINVICYEN